MRKICGPEIERERKDLFHSHLIHLTFIPAISVSPQNLHMGNPRAFILYCIPLPVHISFSLFITSKVSLLISLAAAPPSFALLLHPVEFSSSCSCVRGLFPHLFFASSRYAGRRFFCTPFPFVLQDLGPLHHLYECKEHNGWRHLADSQNGCRTFKKISLFYLHHKL